MSSAEVLPKSSLATKASTPPGSDCLNSDRPCFILLHTSSLLSTSLFRRTITRHSPFCDVVVVLARFTSLKVNR